MIKFESEELRNNLIEELKFVEKTFFKLDNLLYWDDGPCDLKQLLLEQFEFDDEIIIDGNTLITLHPDKTDDLEIYEEVSIHDFFIIMEAYRTINKIDSEKCISPNEALYVIDVREKDYLMDQLFSSDFNGFENDIAVFSTDYKGKEVRCSIVLILKNIRSKNKSIPHPESLYWNVVFFNRCASVDVYVIILQYK